MHGGGRISADAINVLLIDHNPRDVELVRAALEKGQKSAFALESADCLRAGLKRIAEGGIDVVLLDLELPDSKGRNTLVEFRRKAPDIPVVVLTELLNKVVRKGIRYGYADDYLVKGDFGGRMLQRVLRSALEHKRRENELKASEGRFRSIIRTSADGIIIVNKDGIVQLVNPAGEALMGRGATDMLDEPFGFPVLSGRTQELQIIRGDATQVVAEMRVAEMEWKGQMAHLALLRDVTRRKRMEEELAYGAVHDRLTDLPNRALFMERLRYSIQRARRQDGYVYAVLLVDLDNFKFINDSLGHVAGDGLLMETSRRLLKCMRAIDMVARLGGDEFAILAGDVHDARGAGAIAERVLEGLAPPLEVLGQEVFVSASIGIALGSAGVYETPEEALRDADAAMYHAKAEGKARYGIFDQHMRDYAVLRLQLDADLRKALDRRELAIQYQPIIRLQDGRVTGFEALVRWEHPQRGVIAPGAFLPIAEDSGQIASIDQWVMYEACQQACEWQAQFPSVRPLEVNVNLSSKTFAEPDLISHVRRVLRETGLAAECLKLEITETTVMENAPQQVRILFDLQAMSVLLEMDDFGTGYSSLSYLHQFPISTLKIDSSFVGGMDKKAEYAEIVRTIITLAHSLGMAVVAEGVESAEHLARLRELECEYAQGFFFSRPLDSDAAAKLIEAAPSW